MKEKFNKPFTDSKSDFFNSINRAEARNWSLEIATFKQKLMPIGIIALLGLWINLCQYNPVFYTKSIICSAIIISVVFFRTAEQNGDLGKKF